MLVDRLARRLGVDPLDLRLRNMLRPEDLPWTTPSGATYDSGDYARCLRMAADAIDYDGVPRAPGARPRADGRHVGVGLSSFVERTGYASARFLANRGSRYGAHESVTLRANRSGGLDLYTGVSSIGQSAETAYAQVCRRGPRASPTTRSASTPATRPRSPLNTGAFASRTMIAAAGALAAAATELREKTLRIAAHALELDDASAAGDQRRGRSSTATIRTCGSRCATCTTRAINGQGLPDGCEPGPGGDGALRAVRGAVRLRQRAPPSSWWTPRPATSRSSASCSCTTRGRLVNPTLVEGQVHGGLAQGFGAALSEELRYDPDTGQLVNGTMLDYFVPTAADLPPFELDHTEVPSPVTPFGVRGVGETGTIPPGATVANAICDALADFGVEITELPVTPERVWRAIQEARDRSERA